VNQIKVLNFCSLYSRIISFGVWSVQLSFCGPLTDIFFVRLYTNW